MCVVVLHEGQHELNLSATTASADLLGSVECMNAPGYLQVAILGFAWALHVCMWYSNYLMAWYFVDHMART